MMCLPAARREAALLTSRVRTTSSRSSSLCRTEGRMSCSQDKEGIGLENREGNKVGGCRVLRLNYVTLKYTSGWVWRK